MAPSITVWVAPPARSASRMWPICPSFTQVIASDLLGERRVGLVAVRDGHDAVAGAARALREEEREAPASRDEPDRRHPRATA